MNTSIWGRTQRLLLLVCLVAASMAWAQEGTTGTGGTQESTTDPAAEEEDSLVQMIVQFLGDESSDVRALAFEQIRTAAAGERATRVFAAQLSKLPPEGQVGLLSALAVRGDAVARDAALELLRSSAAEDVRVAAAKALGDLGNVADVPTLLGLLELGAAAEQAAARDSLIRLTGASVTTALSERLGQASPRLAVSIMEILAARRALDAVVPILEAVDREDPRVRTAGMAALGQLAGPEHVAQMVRGLLRSTPGSEPANAERAIMFVCRRIEDPEQRAGPVLEAMNDLKTADRLRLMSTLGRIGGSAAREVVEQAIASSDPKTHETGIGALGNWPDASVASRLLELARTDEHADHRQQARRAARVAPLRDDRSDAHRLDLLRTAMVMCETDSERELVLQRARAVRTLDTLWFVVPYIDQPPLTDAACETVVELAHHRGLREPHKAEFDRVLDQVIATSQNPTIVERAQTYKEGKTWLGPR